VRVSRFFIFYFFIFRCGRVDFLFFIFLFFGAIGLQQQKPGFSTKYIISTMSLEAEIRFLEFLCIADVEGRRKKEDRSCYRPQWFQQLRTFSKSGAVAIEVVG
jgi:hypothetical protein